MIVDFSFLEAFYISVAMFALVGFLFSALVHYLRRNKAVAFVFFIPRTIPFTMLKES
jgi:hypothetical protein